MPWILSVLNFLFVKMKMILQNLVVAFNVHFTPKMLLIVTVYQVYININSVLLNLL